MTARDRIQVLLEYLIDVREGLPDSGAWRRDGEYLDLMCKAWNSPAYQELERLLPLMRDKRPDWYWHLAERWLRYGEVKRAYCRKCGFHPPSAIGKVHRHPPGRAVTLNPVIVRSWHPHLDQRQAELGVEWLHEHFRFDPDLPAVVLSIESERRLRAA